MKLLSKIFITLGVLCYVIGIYNIFLINNPKRLSFNTYTYAKSPIEKKAQYPQRIIIKNLEIDLPIISSTITDGEWETTDQGASYLESSPIPGEVGNSIIYGHNWVSLFGNLLNAVPEDEIQIKYDDNTTRTFVIRYTSTVKPETTSILAPTRDKRITLYTCSGFLDSERFVAVAILKP